MRYFLDQDSDNHWYLIPDANREEWDRWTNLDEGDENAWEPPTFAKRLGYHPACLTFTDPHDGPYKLDYTG